MDLEKQKFIAYVVDVIYKHPDWTADTINAMQSGILAKLGDEITAKSNIAYMAVTYIEHAPKITKKFQHNIQLGLRDLYKFFRTAPIQAELYQYIEEDNDELQRT